MSNPFYTVTGTPAAQSRGTSAPVRSEFSAIQSGFDVVAVDVQTGGIYAADSGAANAYVVTVSGLAASYTDGLALKVTPTYANTTGSTINVNSLGVKAIHRRDGSVLQSGDILAGVPFEITYNSAAGVFYLGMGIGGTAGTNGTSGLEVYGERADTSAMLTNADVSKKIKYTGAGGYVLSIDLYNNLTAGWRTRVWNGTTGTIQLTTDGATYLMYPSEERELYVDTVNARIGSVVIRPFRVRTTAAGAGTLTIMPGYNIALGVRAIGAGQGGGGGGGGGTGRGVNTSSGSGGSGGSGGAAGQNGQSVVRRIPFAVLPAVGSTAAYSVGAAGAKGTGGAGGAGAISGNAGNTGNDGVSGSAGGATTFGASTDAYFVSAAGGTAGINNGLKGLGGNNNSLGGAAVTNSATVTAGTINERGSIIATNAIGAASIAGTTQSSVAPGTAGGAGGDTAAGTRSAPRSGTTAAAGGATNSSAVPSPGNNGTTPAAETNPGVGGLGGGGGGGSPGVGGGANAATGVGGTGGDGAAGGPGEIEIWGE